MDSDDLDDFMDEVDAGTYKDTNVYLYYFGDDEDTDGAMKTGNVNINLDGDTYQFQFRKSGGADSRGRSVTGVDDDYIYKYGQRMKADSDEKYIMVTATGDINDDNVEVRDYSGSDVRKLEGIKSGISDALEDGKTKVYYNFNTADDATAYYLVNTSGKIQTGKKSGIKDGDDYYWYMNDDNIIMYTDSKDLANGDEGTNDLKGDWDKDGMTSAGIGSLLEEVNN